MTKASRLYQSDLFVLTFKLKFYKLGIFIWIPFYKQRLHIIISINTKYFVTLVHMSCNLLYSIEVDIWHPSLFFPHFYWLKLVYSAKTEYTGYYDKLHMVYYDMCKQILGLNMNLPSTIVQKQSNSPLTPISLIYDHFILKDNKYLSCLDIKLKSQSIYN